MTKMIAHEMKSFFYRLEDGKVLDGKRALGRQDRVGVSVRDCQMDL